MKKQVIVRFAIPGTHYWKDAFPAVHFLRNQHRHLFHVIAYFEVSHNDREVEFIYTEQQMKKYLLEQYGVDGECVFSTRSCESIAEELLRAFNACCVEVNEDGQGGAVVYE